MASYNKFSIFQALEKMFFYSGQQFLDGSFGLLQQLMDSFEADVKRIMDIDVCQTPIPTPTPTPNTRITDLMKLIDDYGMDIHYSVYIHV